MTVSQGIHIDAEQWVRDFRDELAEGNKYSALMKLSRGGFNGAFFTLTSRYPLGKNVFDEEWDLLLILDACRIDAMREVAPEYEFIDSVNTVWSVGTSSHEWICKTFVQSYLSEIENTMLISTNPNVSRALEDHQYPPGSYSIPLMWPDWKVADVDDLGTLWRLHKHDFEEFFSPPPPDMVSDHVIKAGREYDFERIIAHYFQPHRPYISASAEEQRPLTDIEDQPWCALKSGTATRDEVWELYLDNLRYALDSVERLLNNIDAEKVVISADHGEMMGEFGAYGHPEGFPHPNLKRVPWVETTATDQKTINPNIDIERQHDDELQVEEQLKELGYL